MQISSETASSHPQTSHLGARTLGFRGRLLPGGPRLRARSSPASPRLGPPRPHLSRALARAPRPLEVPIWGYSLASGSGKGPHQGHWEPPRLRVRAAPARRGPRVPAPALSCARQRPGRRASLPPQCGRPESADTVRALGQRGALRPRGSRIRTLVSCSRAAPLGWVPSAGVRAETGLQGPIGSLQPLALIF